MVVIEVLLLCLEFCTACLSTRCVMTSQERDHTEKNSSGIIKSVRVFSRMVQQYTVEWFKKYMYKCQLTLVM